MRGGRQGNGRGGGREGEKGDGKGRGEEERGRGGREGCPLTALCDKYHPADQFAVFLNLRIPSGIYLSGVKNNNNNNNVPITASLHCSP